MPSVVVDYHDTTPSMQVLNTSAQYASAPSYAELRSELRYASSSSHHRLASESFTTNRHMIVCYLPHLQDGESQTISCALNRNNDPIVFTTDVNAAIIPSCAIIDSVEFFGYDTFLTKGDFSIGLGQLNSDISFPLIQATTSTIANERVGGCRDFISCSSDGKNVKNIVLTSSHVNVEFSSPVISGGLQIVIYYHMKKV